MDPIIGTAGWSVPATEASSFPAAGSALERYSAVFAGLEINSSFHRSHRRSTWERWAAGVPDDFRFSVKMPKTITHGQKLQDSSGLLAAALEEYRPLGAKLAVHLIQLPPSLAFDAAVAERFFRELGEASSAKIVCEPRHATWFEPEVDDFLNRWRVGRVAADPAKVDAASRPGGWDGIVYYRLHGSPHMYRSSYDDARLEQYAAQIAAARAEGRETWCIFDNTASAAAAGNALDLIAMLGLHSGRNEPPPPEVLPGHIWSKGS